jgi:hypothetical protein
MVMLMQNLKVDTLFCFCKMMISFTGRVVVNDEYWMYIIELISTTNCHQIAHNLLPSFLRPLP